MKTLEAHEVIREILKKQFTCSFLNINRYKTKYEKEHPDIYVAVSKYDIHHAIDCYNDEFWWDNNNEIILKQEIIFCPFCNHQHKKYPNHVVFNILKDKKL